MTDTEQLRKDILIFIRDHPKTRKEDVLDNVCPTCHRTGFEALRELIDEGLIEVYYTHIGSKIPGSRFVRSALVLTPKGMTAAEAIA